MSPASSTTTAEHCVDRSDKMRATAFDLESRRDEWFAVCYFYAAYHLVRAALLVDPVFKSLKRLEQVNLKNRMHLVMGDRETQRHTGRKGKGIDRSTGINDLVRVLYPQIAVEYLQLHGASIDVRYNSGLSHADVAAIQPNYSVIANAYRSGELTAAELL